MSSETLAVHSTKRGDGSLMRRPAMVANPPTPYSIQNAPNLAILRPWYNCLNSQNAQNLVNLFLTNLVRISGFSSLFLAIAVFLALFAREC